MDDLDLDLDDLLSGSRDELPEGHRSGIVCLAGRPNVGKSTLLNRIVGTKVSIVTPVPGTTRNIIRGVLTSDDLQIAFVDTPGLMKPRKLLNSRLNETVTEVWSGVDAICLVVDAESGIGRGDDFIAEKLERVGVPVICVVNKEDRVTKNELIPVLVAAEELGDFGEIVPTSAVTGMNVDRLVDILADYVPEGPRLFPSGMVSDQPDRQLVGEIIREKFLTRVFEEVPHSIAVEVDEMQEVTRDDGRPLLEIYATIYVERDSQKGIVIGRGGRRIKEGNTQARRELESIFATKVYLDVRVQVAEDWQENPRHLERFGY